ncbi:MAG TPA: tetratricopeptide repeat protein [Thermoanaerobaculia bacterium]|nr:tetratricopeptide repeat protein [Thermoanaerobaculia bacterium]
MDRQQRHDLKHDKFVDEIGVLSSKARENQRILLLIAGGLIAVAVIVYGIFFYRHNREEKAQQALATAIETFEAPVGEAAANATQTGPKFKTEPEKTAAADKLFKEVQSKYDGSDAADVASLYLARMAAARGDTKTARPLLEAFVREHDDHTLAGGARFSLYQMRIEGGEAAQVAVELNAELNKQDPALPADSLLMLLAQAYDTQGQSDKSREAYRRITSEFPESPFAIEAQRRVGA